MKKIMVIGCPGSGKSTFSKALHKKTGIPIFHLDMMYWKPDRTTVDKAVFYQQLSEIVKNDEWIIDGNYKSTIEFRMQFCDTVIFLDYPVDVCLEGVKERRGKERSDMPWTEYDDEEDSEFIDFIKNYNTECKPTIVELIGKYSDKEVYVFSSRKEADAFLNKL